MTTVQKKFEINYSQLIQYEILEKLVTFINDPLVHCNNTIPARTFAVDTQVCTSSLGTVATPLEPIFEGSSTA